MKYVLIAVATALITGLLGWAVGQTRPIEETNDAGRITPTKWLAWVVIIIGMAMCFGGLALTVLLIQDGEMGVIWGLALALMGAAIGGFMAPSLGSWHDVSWDKEGVTGACKTFGPTLARERTTIAWNDIARTGETSTQYTYIEATDGRRIYWSAYYNGRSAFERHLFETAPALQRETSVVS